MKARFTGAMAARVPAAMTARPDTCRGYAWAVSPESSATRGYSASKDQLQRRLARIEGQVRGIQRMVDESRPCPDILVQIAAIEAALDGVALGLLDGHVTHCIAHAQEGERAELTDELMQAMARFMRR